MHVQILFFNLNKTTDAEYRKMCDELAPAFAKVPGLVAKEWLANEGTNTYGGVYHWRDRNAMEAFSGTDLFNSVKNHPALTGIRSHDFEILEGPTRLTRGNLGST